jgi:hypothetical protein
MRSQGAHFPSRRLRLLLWLPVACLLVIGYFGFVYQGYREDGDSPPLHTWPIGAISWALAAIVAWTAIRREPGRLHLWLVSLALAAYVFWFAHGLI